MAAMIEILQEGTEHIQRSFRSFMLGQRLRSVNRTIEHTLSRIGEEARSAPPQELEGCEAWQEVRNIQLQMGDAETERDERIASIDDDIEAIQEQTNEAADDEQGYTVIQKNRERLSSLRERRVATEKEANQHIADLRSKAAKNDAAIGAFLARHRPESSPMQHLFSRLDLAEATRDSLHVNIDAEREILSLMNRRSLVIFYSVLLGLGLIALILVILLSIWLFSIFT